MNSSSTTSDAWPKHSYFLSKVMKSGDAGGGVYFKVNNGQNGFLYVFFFIHKEEQLWSHDATSVSKRSILHSQARH